MPIADLKGCEAIPRSGGEPARATASGPRPLAAARDGRRSVGVLHILKLCVGPRDVASLRAAQERRATLDPPLRHLTRMQPKRAAEVLEDGSLYWVVAGFVCVRQRILDIRTEAAEDGTSYAALVLDPALVAVSARPVKPFQGWRYLTAEAAPPDLGASADGTQDGIDALPEALRRELRLLCLL